mmetsp:Transcript_43586/g.138785  ORF Transcript_43586/g.138785 Transcript_43586/m.138785 type:complete len:341 (-) Transcript_43586:139-1161(-)
MSEQWWCHLQTELSGKLVWFSWEGYPRWPGVVVPPKPRSELLQGKGQFFPPGADVFNTAYVRDYTSGAKRKQERQAGNQKVTERKCREVEPQGKVLVYSLGDEMYKWCRPEAVHQPFHDKLKETYSFPPGFGRKIRSFRDHLASYCDNGFDGGAALKAALHWQAREDRAQRAQREHLGRQQAFAQLHASPGPACVRPCGLPRVFSVETPSSSRKHRVDFDTSSDIDDGALSGSPIKRPCTLARRSSPTRGVPAWLRGELVTAGECLEATESSERFSRDTLQKACAILGVAYGSDEVAWKRAFRVKALEVHPDKVAAHNKAWAHGEMQRVNWAFQYLRKHA